MKEIYRQSLISGLAYGVGLSLGNVFSAFLMQSVPASWFLYGSPVFRLALGILLAFFISGLGGLLGGLVGGYSLPPIGWAMSKGRRGNSWRSGITFGVGYGLLIFPILLIVTLLAFYDVSNTPPRVFSLVFGVVGLVFGGIMGLSLGLWTVGKRFPPITGASMAGFGVGGMFLGYCLWRFLYSIPAGAAEDGQLGWFFLGLLLFGSSGGATLGYIFQRAAARAAKELNPIRNLSLKDWQRRIVLVGLVVLLVALALRPFIKAINNLLTPVDSGLASVLDLSTTGTHWLEATTVTAVSPSSQLALATGQDGALALAWTDADGLWLQTGQWQPDSRQTRWQAPLLVQAGAAADPAVALDENGRSHLAWAQNQTIFLSQCQDGICAHPTSVTPAANCARPPGSGNSQRGLAVHADTALLAWSNDAGIVPYVSWPITAVVPVTAVGCVPEAITSPRSDAALHLIFQADDDAIALAQFDGQTWSATTTLGNGRLPAIHSDTQGQPHVAWCTDDGLFYSHDGHVEFVAAGPCQNRPEIAIDSAGQPHLVWYSPQVSNNTGQTRAQGVLLESIRQDGLWSAPAIINPLSAEQLLPTQPALATAPDNSLHLAWNDKIALQYAAQVQYECDPADLSRYGQILYNVTSQGGYWEPDTAIPYCGNQYDRLIFTPNPEPAYNHPYPPTPNGAFDVLADLIRDAQYEVLFSTMWYDSANNNDSPGSVIATAVADLYRQLQANPEHYPRGLTVRILLGNPPELAMGRATGQLWTLIDDLRQAGVETMVDEELGWRLEVADYAGNLPHSHVKSVVIDGATSVAAGFNMTYDHFPLDHVSGLGEGRFDIGIQITGPMAQASQRAFDDLWQGSNQRVCLELFPPLGFPWQLTCYDRYGNSDHLPETQKFRLTGGDSVAFSLYRSKELPMADQQVESILAAAQERIDVVHVMFALDMICNLNLLFDVCTYENSPDYIDALLQALDNGAHLRLLIKGGPSEGIENTVALNALLSRIEELGLSDRVEIRFYNGSFHPKAVLIDDEVLIVGSQNLHYSAFGDGGGLAEYSTAVIDSRAVSDFRQAFEAEWATATPRQ